MIPIPDHILDCAVIGAGIAGLTAAIALRRAGHRVEVFEKSSFRNEIGAAITLTPNANKVLERWGFDFEKAGSTEKLQHRLLDSETLALRVHVSLADVRRQFGHHFNAYHRCDLHRDLRQMAESVDSLGVPVKIHLGQSISTVDCETGTVILNDESKLSRDLVVIADGVKTKFVEAITGVDMPRPLSGMYVQRGLIETDKLMANDLTRLIYDGQPSGFASTVFMKRKTFIITYPCRNEKITNVAIFHPRRETEQGKTDWNSPTEISDVDSLLSEGFHPAWRELVKCAEADAWKCFPVVQNPTPLLRLSRGKMVIVGDAAHAMAPTHAQGAAMSIEDAAALEVLFTGFKSTDSVERRLQLFNQLRLPRVATTQLLSNAMMPPGSAGPALVERIRPYFDGPVPSDAKQWSKPIQEFFYGYDARSQAEEILKYEHCAEGVPASVMRYFGDFA